MNAQCIILTRDPIYSVFLEMTVREHGFSPRLVAVMEKVEEFSMVSPTVAWIIDLDKLPVTVAEVARKARHLAPDTKLVFMSSAFTRELAAECISQQALGLLVKPIAVARLIEMMSLLRQEITLSETNEVLTESEADAKREEPVTGAPKEHPYLRYVPMKCPVCLRPFRATRFKLWTVPVSDTDTDFCPICNESVHPELYTVVVCPSCYFAQYVGKFGEVHVIQERARLFLSPVGIEERRKIAFNLEVFGGERTLLHGIKSFELAAHDAEQLKLTGWIKQAGEFYLKCSWLCRRMGHGRFERHAQEMALEFFIRAYKPYRAIEGRFPGKTTIQSRMEPGFEPLPERGIVVTGFLIGELSRRLGNLQMARNYFDEVLRLPFLTSILHWLRMSIMSNVSSRKPKQPTRGGQPDNSARFPISGACRKRRPLHGSWAGSSRLVLLQNE